MEWTSVECYHKIKESGLLGEMQTRVLGVIAKHGPITINECATTYFPDVDSRTVSPRFAEIKRRGSIIDDGVKIDKFTGKTAKAWISTRKLPKKPRKPRKISCEHCEGRGWVEDTQMDLEV